MGVSTIVKARSQPDASTRTRCTTSSATATGPPLHAAAAVAGAHAADDGRRAAGPRGAGRAGRRPADLPRSSGTARPGSPVASAPPACERGDRVAIRLPERQRLGARVLRHPDWPAPSPCPVNTRFTESEVEYVVTDSGAQVVIEPGAPLPDGEPLVVDDLGPRDLAAIFYTSGTTGLPEGRDDHAGELPRQLRDVPPGHRLRRRRSTIRNLISVPMFHVTGCNSQLLITHMLGGTVVIMPAFEVQAFLQAVGRRADQRAHLGARHLLAGDEPAELRLVRREPRPLGGLRRRADAARRRRPDRQGVPQARLGNGFGLTETSSVSTFLPHECCEERPETVGFAAPVVEVDLADVDAAGVGRAARSGARTSSPATGTSPSRRPRRSSTAGCTPATSPASTTTASCRSSTARRTW